MHHILLRCFPSNDAVPTNAVEPSLEDINEHDTDVVHEMASNIDVNKSKDNVRNKKLMFSNYPSLCSKIPCGLAVYSGNER